MYDFFMVPLASHQDLANPVYYTVLHNATQGSALAIQPHALYALTYKLCNNRTGSLRAHAHFIFVTVHMLYDLSFKDFAVLSLTIKSTH